jgi:hypothetical protein
MNITLFGTKTHCVCSQFTLHAACTVQQQTLCLYLSRKCFSYHLHVMLRSHNVLTKGTDSDSAPQQCLVMQRDGNLYPLFPVTITFQFNPHCSDSDHLRHVRFNNSHVQLNQRILAKIKLKRTYIIFHTLFSSTVLFSDIFTKLLKDSISVNIFVWSVFSYFCLPICLSAFSQGTNRLSQKRF